MLVLYTSLEILQNKAKYLKPMFLNKYMHKIPNSFKAVRSSMAMKTTWRGNKGTYLCHSKVHSTLMLNNQSPRGRWAACIQL
jgi:hypothetical protein